MRVMLNIPVTVTNLDRRGKITGKWHVRIGNRWRTFGEQEWIKGGIGWVNSQLRKSAKLP
jgi:hypothetical protein